MLIENNILKRIDPEDIIGGVFTAPDEVLYIGDNIDIEELVTVILPNVKEIGDYFLYYDKTITYLEMPKVEKIGNNFLFNNKDINKIHMPNVEKIGYNFLPYNNSLENIDIPKIKLIANAFLVYNFKFKYTPNILKALTDVVYIGGVRYNKKKYIRKMNINKLLC